MAIVAMLLALAVLVISCAVIRHRVHKRKEYKHVIYAKPKQQNGREKSI
jgi:hypothetical protein